VLSTVKVLPRRVAIVGALLMFGLAWVVGASHLTTASAATIDNAITSVNIVQGSAGQNTPMKLDLTWAVPDSANSGDTFTLKLPAELDSISTSFDLLAPDGSVVAKATVVNGLVTFTLTNYVDTHDSVHGSAFFYVRWDKSESSVTGPVSLDFTAGSKVFTDTVNKTGVTGTPRTGPHKTGFWTHQGTVTGTDALTWTLDSPSGPFNTVSFDDTVGPGQTIDCGSVKFRLSTIDASGTVVSSKTLPAGKITAQNCSPTHLTATVGSVVAGQVVRLVYMTNVTDSSLKSYSNSASVTTDGTKTSTVSHSVKVNGAGGSGSGNTPTTTATSPTSTATSPTSTSTTSKTTSPSVSGTSIHASGSPTVLGTKLTAGSSPSALAFTGANVGSTLVVAGLLLGAGILLLLGVQLPSKSRKH
jgi:uncharacterized surface anchored protein